MTRPLREGEINKISISGEEMDELSSRGELLAINELYGIRYATPRLPIKQALAEGNFPVLDWPISRIDIMTQAFPSELCVVYVSPPSIEALQLRLAKDDRDMDGHRLRSAREELKAYESSRYVGICNFEIIAEDNRVPEIARVIYDNYLQFLRQYP